MAFSYYNYGFGGINMVGNLVNSGFGNSGCMSLN